ncbi:MAG TPA: isochorismatase family cysteine hydrolase [Gammaproteobacteria bacterium]|nr:isochorismatase family cysteine hydrolase [Gammaproteobacteria bacterium]
MSDLKLDAKHTALMVMDFQTAIVENYATDKAKLLATTSATLASARKAGLRVIYVVVGFRPGFPEISPRNKSFSGLKERGGIAPDIHPAVAPAKDEPTVTKHRVGAFFGTDLDMLLRAQDIHTLVLCGISTSGVVLSTLRHAADADYQLLVLRDCCSDPDAKVHACLLDKVFPRQATVTTSAELIKSLSA